MALLTTQRGNDSRIGSLPAIEHPGLRLPKGDPIEIHGSATRDGSINAGLPPLRSENNPHIYNRNKKHSRGSTWPIDQERAVSKESRRALTLTQKKTIDELVDLIDTKLSGSFYGIRQAFKANDPRGKGAITKEAFKHILYHLCGYVSAAQFSGLLQRFGLESRDTVVFDDFIRHFKDNEVVDKVWIDPVLRPGNTALNLPANRLKQLQRHQVEIKQSKTKEQGQLFTALQVFPMLKRKVKNDFLEFAKLLPTSCFNEDGTVLKPQLRHALYTLNVHMYDEEYDKLWDRFDQSGLGMVTCHAFFKILGLRGLEIEPSDIPAEVIEHSQTTPLLAPLSLEKNGIPVNDIPENTSLQPGKDEEYHQPTPETMQGDILNILHGKFRSGYNSVLQLCSAFDTKNTGTISRGDFRHVLSKCHLNLGPVEVEHFLSRLGIRDQDQINYRNILDSLEDRTDKGLLQKIMEDTRHRFNRSRESDTGNTSAADAEAKLLDIIHSDFLALLAAFKQLDRESLGVIKKYQFQEMLAARFGIHLTRKQTTELLKQTEAEADDGLVLYAKFLEAFNPKRIPSDEIERGSPTRSPGNRPSTTPIRSPHASLSRPATVQSTRPGTDLEARDPGQLLVDIGELVTDKYEVIKKTFNGINKVSRNCGHLTRETFRKLFDRHDLKMTSREVDCLWKKLPVERDGSLNFIELIKTCFNEAGKSLPVSEGKKKVGFISSVLQNYAKNQVKETLDKFPEEEEDGDEDNMYIVVDKDNDIEEDKIQADQIEKIPKASEIIAKIKNEVRNNFTQIQEAFEESCHDSSFTIGSLSFMDVLAKYCKSLTIVGCNVLCHRFERGDTGKIRYKDFLKVFIPTMPEGTDLIASRNSKRHTRSKTYPNSNESSASQDALNKVMIKVRNKMIQEWKALRRAMKRRDCHDNGFISFVNFKSNLKDFGFNLTDEDYYHILSKFDTGMTGELSYVAFMKETVS